ncbi:MAG: hypothetical protein HF982_05765 [Desulfobacteraceae bacterium]|nr:hypothetical protein [Desulfobacteraceae bacterium]MBC2719084.1 hypothetical protein [Desulfobacteraceae bacterium]
MNTFSLNNSLTVAINSLDKNLRDILIFKYGIRGKGCFSSEETANRFNISIKKMLMLERKAIRKLRNPLVFKQIVKDLESMHSLVWTTVSEAVSSAGEIVYKSESIQQTFDKLQGEILLGIKCEYNTPNVWLSENAYELPIAWFRSKYPEKIVLAAVNETNNILKKISLPVTIQFLLKSLNIDDELMKLVISLVDPTLKFYREYTAKRPLSTMQLRTIRVHLILLHKYFNNQTQCHQIIKEHNSLYTDDHLVPETAGKVMISNPHLFCGSEDKGWKCIEQSTNVLTQKIVNKKTTEKNPKDEKPCYFFERPWSETTAINIVKEILEEKKICHISDINKAFMERVGHRYILVNVSAALRKENNFKVMAPGVYALYNCNLKPDDLNELYKVLLNDKDCYAYITERYAGAPMNIYPLWTPSMERMWCIWAKKHGNDKTYQSLLYIANPSLWATGENLEKWNEEKKWNGCYYFESDLSYPVWEKIPPLQDIFTIVTDSKLKGYINWKNANRSMNLLPNRYKSASILFILIVLEVILPAEHWQKLHYLGPKLDDFISKLIDEIRKKGFVHWEDNAGLYLKRLICDKKIKKNMGWVTVNDYKKLVRILNKETVNWQDLKDIDNAPKQMELPFYDI